MQEINQSWKKIKGSQRPKENFYQKAKILAAIRQFFVQEDFLEVDTPNLVSAPDPNPFNEVFKIEGKDLFLTPSPEFFIKKLLAFPGKTILDERYHNQHHTESDPLRTSITKAR